MLTFEIAFVVAAVARRSKPRKRHALHLVVIVQYLHGMNVDPAMLPLVLRASMRADALILMVTKC